MQGIQNLLSDSHGVFAFLMLIAATILAVMKIMTIDQFEDFAKFVFGAFTVAHVGVSVAGALKRPTPALAPASEEKKS